jgi:predicted component of viral defense system (DUF524 family)
MVRRLASVMFVLCLSAGCGSGASNFKPDAKAKVTPADRFAKEQKRRQQEAEERQRREDFMNRMDGRRR